MKSNLQYLINDHACDECPGYGHGCGWYHCAYASVNALRPGQELTEERHGYADGEAHRAGGNVRAEIDHGYARDRDLQRAGTRFLRASKAEKAGIEG